MKFFVYVLNNVFILSYDFVTIFPSIGSIITLKNHLFKFETSLSNNPNNNPMQSFPLDKIYFPIPFELVYNLMNPDLALIILFPL